MRKKERFTFTLDKETISNLDKIIKKSNMGSRSAAIRYIVNKVFNEMK